MNRILFHISICLFLICTGQPFASFAQCGNGQSPSTAINVCTTDTLSQGAVAACTPQHVPFEAQYGCVNYNPLDYYTGKPMWYKFHCYGTGTFGFYLKYQTNDNYEWQLYDISNRNPNDVFTNDTLAILGSWYVNTLGYKGTAPGQNLIFGCAQPPSIGNVLPLNINETIFAGHDYLLLINHRSATPDYGYKFFIRGGTAVTTPPLPALTSLSAKCGQTQIGLKLNKQMVGSSIALDGSDFAINTPSFSITNAIPYYAVPGTETDSVTLILNRPLLAGTHTLSIKKGTDNNTLYDACLNALAPGVTISVTIGQSRALISGPVFSCPGDVIVFTDSSVGNVASWNWDFGNGNSSTLQNPPPKTYPLTATSVNVPIRLTITDADNCVQTAVNDLKIINNCYIDV
ncbi:MAG: hypothetical protein EOO88_34380, partial [Pedobacter sp.]